MNILHTMGSTADGGAEVYFQDLLRALADSGVVQGAAIRNHNSRIARLSSCGITTRVLPFRKILDFWTPWAISAFASQMNAGVILAWMNRAASLTPAGKWKRIGRLGGYYKLKNYRGFDALVGNTTGIVDYIIREGWPRERVSFIPNFARAAGTARIDRSQFDTPEGVPLLLGMGRLHVSKAHDVSIRALAQLPDAYLWIAGSGPEEAALAELARESGVAGRVRFLGWQDDASSLYRSADLCVFPSRYEPFGNVIIQAWAHGLPVVAAASTGPASVVMDGENGLLVPVDDVSALADRVKRVLADPGLRNALVSGGNQAIQRSYTEQAVVQQWQDLFSRVSGGGA
jgi:glycosyltransferase involved in cell wall biosynthesis